MEKWNNVYFYSYDSSGNVIKNKLISVIQVVDEEKANLIIYPGVNTGNVAETGPESVYTEVQTGVISHRHYSNWEMTVNIEYFYEHYNFGEENDETDDAYYSADLVQSVRARTGAHEMGHVLGLRDLDKNDLCGDDNCDEYHHHEVLMGYGSPITTRSSDMTYKDIAGVAITRGFHTDDDHKWLNAGKQDDRGFKFICSICNGVKYVALPSGYTYDTYGRCNNIHSLAGGNMMAVASYGTKDYYKCKYCRYVAPFELLVEQNYCLTTEDSSGHMCLNNVQGLWYTFYETHSFTRNYVAINKFTHWCYCACGERISKPHVLSMLNGQISDFCIICGELIVGSGTLNSIPINYPHTNNGSYILPNGIIVLVPEDEEAYFAGTLVFRTGEIM